MAPAHIGHGSSVTYRVQPSSRHERRAAAAWVMAIISAWAVGSRSCSRWLCARATTPRCGATMTAPTGTSSAAAAVSASSRAISM
jgi:hypothetical protein